MSSNDRGRSLVEHLDADRDIVTEFGLDGRDGLLDLGFGGRQLLDRGLALRLDRLGGLLGEHLPAPDAGVPFARGLLLTARADDRADGVRFVGFDVDAVGGGDRPIVRIVEDGDVAGGDLAPAGPAVMILEVCLGDALASEMRRRGLPEVRRRDRLVDAGAVGDLLQDVPDAVVRDPTRAGEPTPQRIAIAAGVIVEPPAHVRDRRDQHRRPATGLPVDRQLQSVVVAADVSGGEIEELAGAGTTIPRKGDKRPVAGVEAGLEHGLDVVVPVQHLSGIRRRIVGAGVATGHPGKRLGDVIAVGEDRPDVPEGDAVVFVRLGAAGLFGIDPADDLLGGVTIVDGSGEAAAALGDDEAATEEKLVSVVAVLARTEQQDGIGQLLEGVAIGSADVVGVADGLLVAVNEFEWIIE